VVKACFCDYEEMQKEGKTWWERKFDIFRRNLLIQRLANFIRSVFALTCAMCTFVVGSVSVSLHLFPTHLFSAASYIQIEFIATNLRRDGTGTRPQDTKVHKVHKFKKN
jgi:hypothetical protein